MGLIDGDGSDFFPDTYSEKATVGIVFEGIKVEDMQRVSQNLNLEEASYEVEKQNRLLRRPLIKLLYHPKKEVKQSEFDKKLGTIIENIATFLKKGFNYYFIHHDPRYGISSISSERKAVYKNNNLTFL
jgi:hypothetical protein